MGVFCEGSGDVLELPSFQPWISNGVTTSGALSPSERFWELAGDLDGGGGRDGSRTEVFRYAASRA